MEQGSGFGAIKKWKSMESAAVLFVSPADRSMTHFFDDVIVLPKVEIYTGG